MRLIQFAKAPEVARVKTRLQPYLEAELACELHVAMLECCVERLACLANVNFELWASKAHRYFDKYCGDPTINLHLQSGSDLGERLSAALSFIPAPSIVIGSDCPFIDSKLIARVSGYLHEGWDLVIVPALDGGYVLIGLQKPQPTLFSDIDWGSERVLEQTLKAADRIGLSRQVLEPLSDIDRPEDLTRLRRLGSRFAKFIT